MQKTTKQAKRNYECGNDTRLKVLQAAIDIFGRQSFKSATTREIASHAGVNLATLRYHFGDKEGLYRACAEHIAEHAAASEAMLLRKVAASLISPDISRDELIKLLKELLDPLVERPENESLHRDWRAFADKAEAEGSVAFDIIHDKVVNKIIKSATGLLCRITRRPQGNIDARLVVFALLGSFTFFHSSRAFIIRSLGWQNYKNKRMELLKKVLHKQIDLTIDGLTLPAQRKSR